MTFRHSIATTACLVAAGLLAAAGPPPGVIVLQGRGVQIYDCSAAASGFAWRLLGPQAQLFGPDGADAGKHFVGPTWQAADGSQVIGEAVASGASPIGAIPWLVLRAKAHQGTGLFASVTYVVRSQTSGGEEPSSGCDRNRSGQQARVPYSATYWLFRASNAPHP